MREDLRLPTELWFIIASYTRSRTLRSLFSVNHAFFHASMGARYANVSLTSLKDKKFVRNLVRLSDPFVARRVRSLLIDVNFFAEVEQRISDSHSNREEHEDIHPNPLHLRNATGYIFKSSRDIMQAILRVLPLLTSVSEFTFVMKQDLPSKNLVDVKAEILAKACLESFKHTLRKLKVTVFCDIVPTIFPISFAMENINSLSIELQDSPELTPEDDALPALHVLEMLIRKCKFSLASISLSIENDEENNEGFTPLLKELAAVEGLANLELHLSFLDIPYRPLEQLFMARSKSLKRLSLRSFTSSAAFRREDNANTWLWTVFPRSSILPDLESLEICRSIMYPYVHLNSQWLEPFQKLTAISIKYDIDMRFKDYHYEQCIRQLPLRENLRCLQIQVLFLDKHIFTSLMKSYPNLKCLYLKFGSVELSTFEEDKEKVKSNHANYFRKTLDEKTISQWQIQHLRISSSTYPGRVLRQYQDMFIQVFPSLETCWIH
ncbi:hypothetical protein BDQ17DRAFT_1370347 [Cyathus striatus]|nr:hypothetical protein BDQ17DRAFT_1370347 [Cyathus striatus]